LLSSRNTEWLDPECSACLWPNSKPTAKQSRNPDRLRLLSRSLAKTRSVHACTKSGEQYAHNFRRSVQGPMLWFKKYFRRKNCEKLAFLTRNKAILCKILIITLVFEKTAIFSLKIGKNRRKLWS
jgi:hypothetical protein